MDGSAGGAGAATAPGAGRGAWAAVAAAYVGLAVSLTWPAAARLGELVPGSPAGDLWNSLWSLWFAWQADGLPPWTTRLLDHPDGGSLAVADPLGALLAWPLGALVGLEGAYTLLVIGHIAAAGLVGHAFSAALLADAGRPAGPLWTPAWIAGVGCAAAPVLISAVHNGSSEAIAFAPAVLAAWGAWRVARTGRGLGITALGLALSTLASGYSAVVGALFVGSFALLGVRGGSGTWKPRWGALLLGLALSGPVAGLQLHAAGAEDNLVGIKTARETALVRRTTGAADPRAYVIPGDFRSPDFREISRYGEDFIHCTYLGGALLLLGAMAAGRRRAPRALVLGGALGLGLSLGPVWVMDGAAVIFADERALPLPYLLLEGLPGLSALSLLWRLGQAPAVALALIAPLAVADRPRLGPLVALAVLVELRVLSPVAGLPAVSDARPAPAVAALAAAPPGAVVNFPVVGGRAFLHEQAHHGKPLAGTLNFPNNPAAQRWWRGALAEIERLGGADGVGGRCPALREALARRARAERVRYVAAHADPTARPDMHDGAVAALVACVPPLPAAPPVADGGPHARPLTVFPLW